MLAFVFDEICCRFRDAPPTWGERSTALASGGNGCAEVVDGKTWRGYDGHSGMDRDPTGFSTRRPGLLRMHTKWNPDAEPRL
jgi:hypothetical protein